MHLRRITSIRTLLQMKFEVYQDYDDVIADVRKVFNRKYDQQEQVYDVVQTMIKNLEVLSCSVRQHHHQERSGSYSHCGDLLANCCTVSGNAIQLSDSAITQFRQLSKCTSRCKCVYCADDDDDSG